jgi:hypothetical protein
MDNPWFTAIDTIRDALETGTRRTALEQPGTVAKLPAALTLRVDQKPWPSLVAPGKLNVGFFVLLAAKAHFLMLPKRIVEFMMHSSRVRISEITAGPGAVGKTIPWSDPDGNLLWVEMRIPMASDGLVFAGRNLGRQVPGHVPGEYEVLVSIYHEMTHALLDLKEDAGADIQKLHDNGSSAFDHAVGVGGTLFSGDDAFTEAAAYYVDDKINRWCEALSLLSYHLFRSQADPAWRSGEVSDSLRKDVADIVTNYDAYVPAYGTVSLNGAAEDIKEPWLLDDLRKEINEKVLDGRPLTKSFDDTPLKDLRKTLLRQ